MADFQKHIDRLESLGVKVYALSTDTQEDAVKTVERHGLTFPVGWGLDGEEVAGRFGAYIDPEKGHLQATSFILQDGRVMHTTYSSGPLGRLQAAHVVGFVEYVQQS